MIVRLAPRETAGTRSVPWGRPWPRWQRVIRFRGSKAATLTLALATTTTTAAPGSDALPQLSKRTIVAAVLRRGGPRLLEASIIPSLLFYTALAVGSIGWAYLVAIAWTYGCLARRLLDRRADHGRARPRLGRHHHPHRPRRGQRQHVRVLRPADHRHGHHRRRVPGSIAVGRPLIGKLAHDFWPITPEQAEIPRVQSLL